jgi:hypothetical protein
MTLIITQSTQQISAVMASTFADGVQVTDAVGGVSEFSSRKDHP